MTVYYCDECEARSENSCNVSLQSSRRMRTYLLCEACESRAIGAMMEKLPRISEREQKLREERAS